MGKPQTLACHRFPASFGTMGSVLNAFHPDATASARGLKTWLFTVRAGFGTLGCVLTAFNPDVWPPSNPPRQGTAAAGCRLWHNGLCFNGFQSGRVAALKRSGGVPLPLALLGASKLAFSLFSSTLWHNGLCFNSSQSGRLAAHAPPPIERGKGYPSVIPCCLRTW